MKRALLGLGLLWLAVLAMPASAKDRVYYYYTDTLHSAAVETDAQGKVIERTYYAPYGQVLNRAMRDEPGYTGHEEDPATGLVYMQQRYYDPDSGRFLSTDPVLPTSDGGDFNRYWYAKDNPYRYTDPTGATVGFALQDTSLSTDYQQMMTYLSSSPTFVHMLSQLKSSDTMYVIELGTRSGGSAIHSRYLQAQHIILINPKLGMKIKSSGKIESPSLIGAHEIAHAYLQDKLGDQKFNQSFKTPVLKKDGTAKPHDSAGEEQATSLERQVAHDLGTPARSSYTDVQQDFVHTCGVTSTKTCSN